MTKSQVNDPSLGLMPNWRNVVEYIEDITYRIWEQGDLDLIKDTYSKTCPIFTLQSCCNGHDIVIKNTRHTLAIFPDRTLYPEGVLWNGDNGDGTIEQDDDDGHGNIQGYHSSHLINSKMTYHHPKNGYANPDSDFSASSDGKQARIWVIAHCIIRNGVIVKEWLVRDNKYLYEQLGVCPQKVANKWAQMWMNELEESTSSIYYKPQTHYDWLQAEFSRVTSSQNIDLKLPFKVDLQNVFPISEREKCSRLAQLIVSKYKLVWGKEGMSSKDKFGKLLRDIYHPHARFESPQAHDLVGYEELENLYDSFIFGNEMSENVEMSIDWIIIDPQISKNYGEFIDKSNADGSPKPYNKWIYPTSDDAIQVQYLENEVMNHNDSTNVKGCLPESYTIAIRWTLVGSQNQLESQDGESKFSVPIVLLAESHLRCVGIRIKQDITVYDEVALMAQVELGKRLKNKDLK